MIRKNIPLLLFAFIAAVSPAKVSSHETFYLRDDGSFSAFNPTDRLSFFFPTKGTVLDYDMDGREGLTILRNNFQ